MKSVFLFILFASFSFADMNTPPAALRTYRFDKIVNFNHSYIVLVENVLGAQNQILHDPDCQCRKFTEEQIAKVIQEVLRLKDLEVKIQMQQGINSPK